MTRLSGCAALAGVVIALSMLFQRPISYNGGLGWDGAQYAALAAQCGREPMRAMEPYAYRIGAPCLAALLPGPPQRGLLLVNVAAATALLFLLDAFLRRYLTARAATIVLVAFAVHWVAPLRQVWWYPTYIDPLALSLMVAALLAADRLVLFVVLCFLGALARETTAIVPIAVAGGALVRAWPGGTPTPTDRRLQGVLGIVASLAGIVLAHRLVTSTADYGFVDAVVYWAFANPLTMYLLAIFIAFGPALGLLALEWPTVKAHLRREPEHGLLLIGVLGMAWIGGSDTERFLMWGVAVVLVLIGKAVERIAWSEAVGATTLLLVGQLISARVFLATPADHVDPAARAWPILTPWFPQSYLLLFSQTPDRVAGLVALAQYLVLTIVVVTWFGWRRASRRAMA